MGKRAEGHGAHRRDRGLTERHLAEDGGVGVLDLFGAGVFLRHKREPPAEPLGAEDPDMEIAVRK